MDIFISWHGKRSHAVAVALRDWLPQIVNDFKPWLSSSSIDKGSRWSPEIAAKLATAKAGIFCLTPSNLVAPWVLFEAGAISKSAETTYVCTLLVGLQASDVTDPLAQFQATKLTKDDLLQLVKNLNGVLGDDHMPDAHVEKAFEKWWPDLETELKKLPSDESSHGPRRDQRDLLEEVLEKVRDMSNRLQDAPVPRKMRTSRFLPPNEIFDAIKDELMDAAIRFPKDPEGAFSDFQQAAEAAMVVRANFQLTDEEVARENERVREAARALGEATAETYRGKTDSAMSRNGAGRAEEPRVRRKVKMNPRPESDSK